MYPNANAKGFRGKARSPHVSSVPQWRFTPMPTQKHVRSGRSTEFGRPTHCETILRASDQKREGVRCDAGGNIEKTGGWKRRCRKTRQSRPPRRGEWTDDCDVTIGSGRLYPLPSLRHVSGARRTRINNNVTKLAMLPLSRCRFIVNAPLDERKR